MFRKRSEAYLGVESEVEKANDVIVDESDDLTTTTSTATVSIISKSKSKY